MKLKLTTITLIFAIIVFILVGLAVPKIAKLENENAELRNYNKQLEVNLSIKSIQVKDLQDELTGCYQELEAMKIDYYANILITKELKHRYLITKSYAEVAESLLLANDIPFRQVD